MYLSPPSPTQSNDTKNTDANEDDKNNTTLLIDLANDITLTPSTSFLQLDISNHDKEEMNVLECSEITLGSSFLTELDSDKDDVNSIGMVAADTAAAVDRSLSSRLDVSDNMNGDEIEIVMNEDKNIKREVKNTTEEETADEVTNESIDTNQAIPTALDISIDEPQQHTLNNSTITCDDFISEAQTSFIENVKLGYNIVTNKLEKEFIDMGFADCISG